MNATTLEALNKSIAHWDDLRNGRDNSTRAGACALCRIFNKEYLDTGNGCAGCPIKERTGLDGCRGTPYYDVIAYDPALSPVNFKKEANRMYEFLVDLLPKQPPIDWSKPIQTKDGKPARYLGCIDNVVYPHIVAVTYADGEAVITYDDDGRRLYHRESDNDIINTPTTKTIKRKFWVMHFLHKKSIIYTRAKPEGPSPSVARTYSYIKTTEHEVELEVPYDYNE